MSAWRLRRRPVCHVQRLRNSCESPPDLTVRPLNPIELNQHKIVFTSHWKDRSHAECIPARRGLFTGRPGLGLFFHRQSQCCLSNQLVMEHGCLVKNPCLARALAGRPCSAWLPAILSSGMIIIWQMYVINLDRTGSNYVRFQRVIIISGPAPLLRASYQTPTDRVEMHILQSLREFLVIPNESLSKLMLPIVTPWALSSVQPAGTDRLDALHNL